MMKYLLIIASLVLFAHCAPTEDEVSLTIPGYTAHHWYSGTDLSIHRFTRLRYCYLPLRFLRFST